MPLAAMPASAALAVPTRSRAATARVSSMVRRRVTGPLLSGDDGWWSAGIRPSRAGGLACVALASCRITRRLFLVTMPRRSCGMLSDSRNEWEEAVTAPVRTKRRSPHVRTAVGMFDEHRRQQDARRRQFEVR
jgi:hypothetical protein